MSNKNLKTEIKKVVENLANIEFTTEDELEFCKSILEKRRIAIEEIKGLAQSINDYFKNDDIEQQLHYAKEVAEQIEQICKEVAQSNPEIRISHNIHNREVINFYKN